MSQWNNFFIVAAGASAALAGLVIVAISVNIARILEFTHLPTRAGATIGCLLLILVSSLATLVPQPMWMLGSEVLAFSLSALWLRMKSAQLGFAAGRQFQRPRFEAMFGLITGQLQTLPFLIGAGLLVTGRANGFYWIATGVVCIFLFSTLDIWILLVEILR